MIKKRVIRSIFIEKSLKIVSRELTCFDAVRRKTHFKTERYERDDVDNLKTAGLDDGQILKLIR